MSDHARRVLAILLESREACSHGYDLVQRAGVRSGTLYPLLIRLEQRGLLEAEWQPPREQGRPPRHAYRLTAAGAALAHELAAPSSSGTDKAPAKALNT